MAINLDEIRKRLKTLKTSSNTTKLLWKPAPGKTVIRILPYQYDKDVPFLELYFHYNCGKKNYLSLVTFGEDDPINEFSEQLKSTGDTEEWKFGKRLEPTQRTYVPIIIRGKEEEGVKFWGFGKEIYMELLNTIDNPDYGDITDLNSGRDIDVTYMTAAEAGNKYGKVEARVKPNASKFTNSKKIAEICLKEQPKIDDVFVKPTYEELKKALETYLATDEKAAEVLGTELSSNDDSKDSKEDPIVDNDKMDDDFLEEINKPIDKPVNEEKKVEKESDEISDFDDLFPED